MRCGSCFIPKGSPLVAHLTTATNLAVKVEKSKPKTTLPSEYAAFSSVFSEEASSHLPPSRPYNHAINLDETFVPKIGKVYLLSSDEQKATESFLEENLCSGKIRPSKSPQASFDKLKGAKVFTKFDVQWGYNNVRIKEGDQWKGAFISHKGLFEPTVMFFGMNNSPSTFQRFMNDSF
jgi:hypothetical protein